MILTNILRCININSSSRKLRDISIEEIETVHKAITYKRINGKKIILNSKSRSSKNESH